MTSLKRVVPAFVGFSLAVLLPGVAGAGPVAPVFNVRLVTDSSPDLTDVPGYLRSITSQYETPEEQAVAIWSWSQRMRKQTSNPQEGGQDVLDPILLFNNYGHCNCGIVSGLNNTFWLNMGWKAHYVQLGDHTVCETSWDGGRSWHMFDASMSFYCFNDAGQIASVDEIARNPRYYLENYGPGVGTNPVKGTDDHQGWRNGTDRPVGYRRTLANGYDSFRLPNGISGADLHTQWGHRFAIDLRPGDSYTRYFQRRDLDSPGEQYYRPLKNGKDVENQHGHRGIRANGVWQYQPDLRDPGAGDLVYEAHDVVWGTAEKGFAVKAAEASKPGTVTFRVSAANVATSAKLFLTTSRRSEKDSVTVEVSSTAGITYEPAWTSEGADMVQASEIDLQSLVAGATEFLVRVHLSGEGAGLESLRLETLTQINRASLPRLSRGANRVQLTLGNQAETVQFRPSVVDGNHRDTVEKEVAIDVEKEMGFYKPILRPAENEIPASVTWKVKTPTPITAVDYGATVCVKSSKDRVSLLHSWDGENFVSDFEKRDESEPWDLVVNRSPEMVPSGMKDVFLRYEFATERNKRSYSGPGIQMARMRVEHEPRVKGFTPIEVTYCWVEHREEGEVERQHTGLVESPEHEYIINVGGYRDPTMRWIRMKLQGTSAPGGAVIYGYSDGLDVGSGEKKKRTRFTWGRNLALGQSYTLSGAVNEKNPDAGNDLSDGIIAPPSEDVSLKYMPTNVMFEKDSVVVVTVDLEKSQEVAGLRINAGQEIGFHLAFPETITVETSIDGEKFTLAGEAGHHQVFDPPADFIPWEHDDSPAYAALPAGGRLAFPYRVIFEKPQATRYLRVTCRAQEGWGQLLSEIQAFDTVAVDDAVPPLVYLPELKP
ncbi:hypothetical protein V2O64_19130 [Verrucomicrobiaceae bacterium 227]